MKLKERVAIVTGAASGIGKAIAEVFACAGAKVMAADINLDGVLSVVEGIKANGGVASAFKANVALQEDIDRLVEETVKEFGTVDILVNNAGIMDKMEPAGDITDEQWERSRGQRDLCYEDNQEGFADFLRKKKATS